MLQITVRAFLRAAGALALASTLVACGGSRDETDTNANALSVGERISVKGADGASVSYLPAGNQKAQAVTVRVARDGSGAPPLPTGYVAAGAVYQFTPLGLARPGIEVRVPLGADATPAAGAAPPVLLVAQPGGSWMQLTDVVREGDMLVATVPQLAYAVSAIATGDFTQGAGAGKTDRLQAYTGEPQTNPVLRMVVDAATTPPLPDPVVVNNSGAKLSTVTQETALSLTISYNLPAVCTGTRTVEVKAATSSGQQITLARHVLSQPSGSFTVATSLSAAPSGFFVAAAGVECSGQTAAQRYTTLANPPLLLLVNIAATPAPAITQAPQDANVVEGATATFSVTASGSAIAYQWQRSNDGGSTYANVPGATAASVSVAATLADNNSLWRVVLSNAGGSTTSTPARLGVTQQVVVPAITSDPANQTVVEGQTASFTVAGSGAPAPTTQWQTRSAADAASGNAQQGWADVPGATAATTTTAATTLAQSGVQYRAVLQNSAGSASSLAATLTVNAAVVAPAITTQPLAQSVQAGQSGLFAVAASGTSPLSYQWFKNGQAIVGANATEVLVLAEAADVGSSYQISVQVSNAAGSVSSAVVVMSITAAPVGGTLINAAQGGFISANTGAEVEPTLIVPPGALAADTTLSVTVQSSTVANLPAQIVALGDVINIGGPAGATFSTPATLYLAVPDAIAEGKVLAVVELETDAPTGSGKTGASSAKRTAASTPYSNLATSNPSISNLRRVAASQSKIKGGAMLMASGDPLRVLCPSPQAIRGRAVLVDLERAATRFVVAEAPEGACTGNTTTRPRAVIPPTTTNPCTDAEYPAVDGGINQVSRHVHCQRGQAETVLSFAPDDQPAKNFGRYQLQWRIGSDGVAKELNKTYRVKLRLVQLEAGSDALSGLRVMPVYECGADLTAGLCKADSDNVKSLGVGGEIEIASTVNFSWDVGDNTFKEFAPQQIRLKLAFTGEDINTVERNVFLSQPPTLRCDKGMAVNGGRGCVYAQAPAVLVLTPGGDVKEAVEHIRDAQASGSSGALTIAFGAYFAAPSNALQRTRVTGLRGRNTVPAAPGANRLFSCSYADSIIRLRPQNSSTCPADGAGCECDEYPFNSTWNGSFFNRDSTSARYINGPQNREAGNRLQRFFQAERVLDYTPDPGVAFNIGNEAESIPSRLGGDDFWVHVE